LTKTPGSALTKVVSISEHITKGCMYSVQCTAYRRICINKGCTCGVNWQMVHVFQNTNMESIWVGSYFF